MERRIRYKCGNKDICDVIYTGKGVHAARYVSQDLLKMLIARYGEYVCIELGPGKNKACPAGIGLNEKADPTADIWIDLNLGIPLPSNSVDRYESNQFLEHLRKENQIFFWNEMWRTLKPGGTMKHCVPHYLSPDSDGDPTHFTSYTENSVRYYCIDQFGEPFVKSFSDYGIECRFELIGQVVRQRVDIVFELRKPEEE